MSGGYTIASDCWAQNISVRYKFLCSNQRIEMILSVFHLPRQKIGYQKLFLNETNETIEDTR